MRSPLTPPPEGLSVLTSAPGYPSIATTRPVAGPGRVRGQVPVLALHAHPSGIGGHLAGSCNQALLVTKPPCEGSRASWLLGGLASSPAWAQLASVCTPSLHACVICSPLPLLSLLLPLIQCHCCQLSQVKSSQVCCCVWPSP